MSEKDKKIEQTLRILAWTVPVGLAAPVVYSLQFLQFVPLDLRQFLMALGTGLAVVAASLIVGALLGFLFGLPRAPQILGPIPELAEQNTDFSSQRGSLLSEAGTPPQVYRPGTNLEDISDWLTKILVGVGLTQIGDFTQWLKMLGEMVAPGLGGVDSSAAMGIALVLYHTVCGFLLGFIWTVRYGPAMFQRGRDEASETAQNLQILGRIDQMKRVDPKNIDIYEAAAAPFTTRLALTTMDMESARTELSRLQRAYEKVRETPAGTARTLQMESIMRMAKAAAEQVSIEPDEIRELFETGKQGSRIVSLALIQNKPSGELFEVVLKAIKTSRSAFEQYHALLALNQLMPLLTESQKEQACSAIGSQRGGGEEQRIRPGTDRWALSDVLRSPNKLNCPD